MLRAAGEFIGTLFGAGAKAAAPGATRATRSVARNLMMAGLRQEGGASVRGLVGGALKSVAWGGGWNKASLLKSGIVGGLKFGAASLVEDMADSPWGQEQSPFARMLLNMGAFGLRASGVRSFARGVVGTGLSAAGRWQGDPGKYFRAPESGWHAPRLSQDQFRQLQRHPRGSRDYLRLREKFATQGGNSLYDRIVTQKLGGVFQGGAPWRGWSGGADFWAGTGSLYNAAGRAGLGMAAGAGKAILKLPFQMALGAPQAATTWLRMGGEAGRLGVGLGSQLLPGAGVRAWGRRFASSGRSWSSIVTPQMGFGLRKPMQALGLVGHEGHAPIMAGTFALAGGATYLRASIAHNERRGPGRGMNQIPMQPGYFQGGIRGRMHGPFRNYGPALTLALHNNSSRVMP